MRLCDVMFLKHLMLKSLELLVRLLLDVTSWRPLEAQHLEISMVLEDVETC